MPSPLLTLACWRMIDWLTKGHGLAPEEAYVLCGVAGDLKLW
jgi:acetamidase/formamidase